MSFLFGYRGRFSRLQWWGVQAIAFIFLFGVFRFFGFDPGVGSDPNFQSNISVSSLVLFAAAFVIIWWITITASIKRYHDRNKSGWWYLICFIPIIGPIWQIVELGFLGGTDGNNDYDVYDNGDKPAPYSSKPVKAVAAASVVAAPVVASRRIDVATGRPGFGQKAGFGTRRA